MKLRYVRFAVVCILATALGIVATAVAQTAPDAPSLAMVSAGHGKVRLTITAGPSGAPEGFALWWATGPAWDANGGTWPVPGQGYAAFTGVGTLNTWGAEDVSFQLAPNQSLDVEIGDLFDESGVAGDVADELVDGQEYYFCAYAIGQSGGGNSPLSVTLDNVTSVQGQNCTYSQGYWKTHSSAWPVASLTLGTVTYTKAQLLSILGQPVAGNGLVSLAHQLIAAKLNFAFGADPSTIAGTVTAADVQIGSLVIPPVGSGSLTPGSTSAKTQTLDDYNNGVTGPGHCGETPALIGTWGRLKGLYR